MSILIYGAYGYTGELIATEAVDRGLDVTVAGRDGTKTRGLAAMLDTDSRVFDVEQADTQLDGIDIVLNCAGPFVETYKPLVDACLDTGTHYLDITGEFPVFEALAERDRDAEKAESLLLPGIGFDVVPTDCVASHLHDRLPSANELRLGFEAMGALSGGTVASIIEHGSGGGKVRRDGKIVEVPFASQQREIDFGAGMRHAVTIPWGDVATAYYTTGIENIEVYTPMSATAGRALQIASPATAILEIDPIKDGLQWLAKQAFSGPSETRRNTETALIWGEVTDGERTMTTRLRTPEPYALTVDAATTALERLQETSSVPTGYHTPASAFDPAFVLGLEDVDGFFDEETTQ